MFGSWWFNGWWFAGWWFGPGGGPDGASQMAGMLPLLAGRARRIRSVVRGR